MKIFVAHSSNFDFRNELYLPLRNSRLNKQHEIILPQEKDKEVITKEVIKDCDIIVAEVSFPSTGQGIELGWADIFEIPIICMYKQGSKISGSLSKLTQTFILYSNPQNMIIELSTALLKRR